MRYNCNHTVEYIPKSKIKQSHIHMFLYVSGRSKSCAKFYFNENVC